MEIRRATLDDARAIAHSNIAMAMESEGTVLPEATILRGVEGLFARPQFGFYIVAEEDGAALGVLLITFEWSDWRNGLIWWVQSVYVVPEHRGKGVYRAMYNEVKRLGAKQGDVRGFRLYVDKENTAAQEVYRRTGMSQTNYLMFEELPKP